VHRRFVVAERGREVEDDIAEQRTNRSVERSQRAVSQRTRLVNLLKGSSSFLISYVKELVWTVTSLLGVGDSCESSLLRGIWIPEMRRTWQRLKVGELRHEGHLCGAYGETDRTNCCEASQAQGYEQIRGLRCLTALAERRSYRHGRSQRIGRRVTVS